MKEYKVIRDNWGFRGRMWYKDQIVELEDDAIPPHHFELIGSSKTPKKQKSRAKGQLAYSEMSMQAKPKGGFAHTNKEAKQQRVVTASEKLKNDKGKK